MKFSSVLLSGLLAACGSASPVVYTGSIYEVPDGVSIDELVSRGQNQFVSRQSKGASNTSLTANDFLDTGCKDVILMYARGSTQSGNLGDQPGPQLAASLQSALGANRVALQGIDYPAGLPQNLIPGGTNPKDAANMADLISNVSSTCPNSQIVVSGYSQGAAMVHRSVEQISNQTVINQIVAGVTFGDTQKKQDNSQIPNLDAAKTLILCNDGDKVCNGTLIITNAHLDYTDKVQQASNFITSLVK